MRLIKVNYPIKKKAAMINMVKKFETFRFSKDGIFEKNHWSKF